jgi:hypothetical protein
MAPDLMTGPRLRVAMVICMSLVLAPTAAAEHSALCFSDSRGPSSLNCAKNSCTFAKNTAKGRYSAHNKLSIVNGVAAETTFLPNPLGAHLGKKVKPENLVEMAKQTRKSESNGGEVGLELCKWELAQIAANFEPGWVDPLFTLVLRDLNTDPRKNGTTGRSISRGCVLFAVRISSTTASRVTDPVFKPCVSEYPDEKLARDLGGQKVLKWEATGARRTSKSRTQPLFQSVTDKAATLELLPSIVLIAEGEDYVCLESTTAVSGSPMGAPRPASVGFDPSASFGPSDYLFSTSYSDIEHCGLATLIVLQWLKQESKLYSRFRFAGRLFVNYTANRSDGVSIAVQHVTTASSCVQEPPHDADADGTRDRNQFALLWIISTLCFLVLLLVKATYGTGDQFAVASYAMLTTAILTNTRMAYLSVVEPGSKTNVFVFDFSLDSKQMLPPGKDAFRSIGPHRAPPRTKVALRSGGRWRKVVVRLGPRKMAFAIVIALSSVAAASTAGWTMTAGSESCYVDHDNCVVGGAGNCTFVYSGWATLTLPEWEVTLSCDREYLQVGQRKYCGATSSEDIIPHCAFPGSLQVSGVTDLTFVSDSAQDMAVRLCARSMVATGRRMGASDSFQCAVGYGHTICKKYVHSR